MKSLITLEFRRSHVCTSKRYRTYVFLKLLRNSLPAGRVDSGENVARHVPLVGTDEAGNCAYSSVTDSSLFAPPATIVFLANRR